MGTCKECRNSGFGFQSQVHSAVTLVICHVSGMLCERWYVLLKESWADVSYPRENHQSEENNGPYCSLRGALPCSFKWMAIVFYKTWWQSPLFLVSFLHSHYLLSPFHYYTVELDYLVPIPRPWAVNDEIWPCAF